MKLNQQHFQVMKDVDGGATIWGYKEAKLLREVQEYNENLVHIIGLDELEKIQNHKFDGTKQLPYFGAVLTESGKEFLEGVTNE